MPLGFKNTDIKKEPVNHKVPNLLKPLSEVDIQELQNSAISYVEDATSLNCNHEDCDCKHYIFEEVIDAFYKKEIWDVLNKQVDHWYTECEACGQNKGECTCNSKCHGVHGNH